MLAGVKFIAPHKIYCPEIGIPNELHIFRSHKSLSTMHIHEVWLHSLRTLSISITDFNLCGKLEQLPLNLSLFMYVCREWNGMEILETTSRTVAEKLFLRYPRFLCVFFSAVLLIKLAQISIVKLQFAENCYQFI